MIDDGEVVDATPTAWVEAVRAVARERQMADSAGQSGDEGPASIGPGPETTETPYLGASV